MQQTTTIPKTINFGSKEQFEALGIVYGQDVDDLFVTVTLPNGWRRTSTRRNWYSLLDSRDRVRANIFYQPNPRNRSAHISIVRRYSFGTRPVHGYGPGSSRNDNRIGVVTDQDKIIWRSVRIVGPRDKDGDASVKLAAKEWLVKHYPDWGNPLAYWE